MADPSIAKRENWYTTAEKVLNGRGYHGVRSAQAEQCETCGNARTVSAADLVDQLAGFGACDSSPWECAGGSRRRRLACSVSNTPGHNGLRWDRVCARALEASLVASTLTLPCRGKKSRRPVGNHSLFPAGLGAWPSEVDDAAASSLGRWWSLELPGMPVPTARAVAEDG